jgi:integration host factor subunit beta
VTFKPGKEMEERVRQLERREAEEAAARQAAESPLPSIEATPPPKQPQPSHIQSSPPPSQPFGNAGYSGPGN